MKIMSLLLDGDNFTMYCAGGPKPTALYADATESLHQRSGRIS